MEGSRPPDGSSGGARGGFMLGNAAVWDEVSIDRHDAEEQRIIIKPEPPVGQKLEEVVKGEIVPRLMLLHKQKSRVVRGPHARQAANLSSQVHEFTDLVILHEANVIEAYVKALLQRGLELETLLLHLFAPAARRLGELWEADSIDFVDVTIATCRLQQILHRVTFHLEKNDPESRRRVMLVPTPSEQHTFGLLMVSEFFRREGWNVTGDVALSAEELTALVSDEWFTLVGFSLSCERLLETLCSTIQLVRRFSKNQSVHVIVGGRIFAQDPCLRPQVGADLVASDAREALELAERVLCKGSLTAVL